MALYAVTLVGMAPFGSLFAGTLASFVGAPATLVLAGFICALGVGALAATESRATAAAAPRAS